MGKQAKKKQKSDSHAAEQRSHNPGTRGVNTTRRGVIWAYRQKKIGDEVEHYQVVIPPRTGWDPFDGGKNSPRAPEPFDSLSLDWREQTMHWAVENGARIGSKLLPNGRFLHRVFNGGNVESPDILHFEIESSQKMILRGKKKKK